MTKYSIIGRKTPRADTVPLATGEARYSDDMSLPGMLHGKVLYSPYAHARILSIDTSKAERLPGVKAVITGKDTPGKPLLLSQDTFILTRDKARYTGDAVAAVAAVDEDTAEEALNLIKVEYEILPVLVDPQKAMQPGAVRIHDRAARNIVSEKVDGYGDVEKGFQESYYVREDTFKFSLTAYMHPGPSSAIASFDSASGRLSIWTGSMSGYRYRSHLAAMLDVPYRKVKVIAPYVAASFGGRSFWVFPSQLCASLLSQKTRLPVKVTSTTEEDFNHRLGFQEVTITVKTGVRKDGTLLAREASSIFSVGAYSGLDPQWNASLGSGIYFHVPFKVPNLRVKRVAVYVNRPPHGPLRSYGGLGPLWACELQMGLIARELGIDPVDMMIKNACQPDSETPLGLKIMTCGLDECIREAGRALDWKAGGEKLPAFRGRGIGASIMGNLRAGQPGNPLVATVTVNSDGTADLLTLGSESGSGQSCAMRMIVAEELGIPLESVCKPDVDTDHVLENEGTSFITISLLGKAPQMAAVNARQMVLEVMAYKMETDVNDLECKNGRVYVKGRPGKGIPFAEAARIAIAEKGPIVGRGEFISPLWKRGADKVKQVMGRLGMTGDTEGHSFGATGAEVEVDSETGSVRILRLAHAYDVGFALNPLAVEGQLQGVTPLSIGPLLTEEVLVGDNGQILNASYLQYGMPSSVDMPDVVPVIVETESGPVEGPFGAKELGMGSVQSGGPAVINAIYDAIGVMPKKFPATPDRILKALNSR